MNLEKIVGNMEKVEVPSLNIERAVRYDTHRIMIANYRWARIFNDPCTSLKLFGIKYSENRNLVESRIKVAVDRIPLMAPPMIKLWDIFLGIDPRGEVNKEYCKGLVKSLRKNPELEYIDFCIFEFYYLQITREDAMNLARYALRGIDNTPNGESTSSQAAILRFVAETGWLQKSELENMGWR